jgi:hypothetical protein
MIHLMNDCKPSTGILTSFLNCGRNKILFALVVLAAKDLHWYFRTRTAYKVLRKESEKIKKAWPRRQCRP